MSRLAFDTSAAVPLLVATHTAHGTVRRHALGRSVVLTTHSLAETYSVLTRLPADARLAPEDALRLIDATFGPPVSATSAELSDLPRVLAGLDLSGGAVYDALVALAARAAQVPLATRDARALATYSAVGVQIEIIAD